VVDGRVGDHDQARLLVAVLGVIGEGTGGEPAGGGGAADEPSKLQDGPVAHLLGGDHADVLGVLDGGDDPGGQDDLLPHLADVEDAGAALVLLVDVLLHLVVAVLLAEVHLGGKDLLGIAVGQLEGFEGLGHFWFGFWVSELELRVQKLENKDRDL